jgi:hypothetical protein
MPLCHSAFSAQQYQSWLHLLSQSRPSLGRKRVILHVNQQRTLPTNVDVDRSGTRLYKTIMSVDC